MAYVGLRVKELLHAAVVAHGTQSKRVFLLHTRLRRTGMTRGQQINFWHMIYTPPAALLYHCRLCVNQMHVVVSLGNALHVGSKSCLYEFTELNFLSVGSQLPPRTLNTLID